MSWLLTNREKLSEAARPAPKHAVGTNTLRQCLFLAATLYGASLPFLNATAIAHLLVILNLGLRCEKTIFLNSSKNTVVGSGDGWWVGVGRVGGGYVGGVGLQEAGHSVRISAPTKSRQALFLFDVKEPRNHLKTCFDGSADTEGGKDIKIKAFSSGRRAVKRSHSWRYTESGTLAP